MGRFASCGSFVQKSSTEADIIWREKGGDSGANVTTQGGGALTQKSRLYPLEGALNGAIDDSHGGQRRKVK